MKKTFVILLLIGFAACSSYKPVAPTQSDADRGAQKYPGLSLADLNQGKAIFEAKCEKCHSLKRPFMVSNADVEKIMPKMAMKANLDHKSADLVLQYLLTMKSAPKK